MTFVQDGLSADGEQLLELLSSANIDTADPPTTASAGTGASTNLHTLFWDVSNVALPRLSVVLFQLAVPHTSKSSANDLVWMEGMSGVAPEETHTHASRCSFCAGDDRP